MATKRAIRLKDLSRPWRVALALSLFLHGCGGESGGVTAAVYDSAGVRIVENRDVEGHRTSTWTVSPEATLHLGGTSATRGAELFSELNGVTRLAGGEVVVLEGNQSELRFFGEDGEHIRTIGGMGEGPGELKSGSFISRGRFASCSRQSKVLPGALRPWWAVGPKRAGGQEATVGTVGLYGGRGGATPTRSLATRVRPYRGAESCSGGGIRTDREPPQHASRPGLGGPPDR